MRLVVLPSFRALEIKSVAKLEILSSYKTERQIEVS